MFIIITSLFREVKLITTLIINITQHNTTKVLFVIIYYLRHIHFVKKRCIPTPKKLKLYNYKCFYLLKLGSHRGDDRCRPTSSPTTSLVRMHGIRRPSSQNGRRTAKRLGDEYQNFLILVAQDSSLKATAIIAVGGNQALKR